MDLHMQGKRALVTGASRGLGFAIAQGLAREGCRVVINSRDQDRLMAASKALSAGTGSQVVGLRGDVSDPAVPGPLVRSAVEALGGLDLLVTNAGGPPAGTFESIDDATWQQGIDLVFMAHVRLIRAALPYLRNSDSASVLTMASYAVKQPMQNLVLSNSIRLATIGLTKSLALELGPDGLRFNSILPASIDTDRIRELAQFRADRDHTSLDEELARPARQSVFGRMGRPEELANVAVFLLSPAASYVTGVMMVVDGGQYKGML